VGQAGTYYRFALGLEVRSRKAICDFAVELRIIAQAMYQRGESKLADESRAGHLREVRRSAIAADDKDIGFTQEEFLNRFDVGIQNPWLDGGFDDGTQ
jgi:hypothetical protein